MLKEKMLSAAESDRVRLQSSLISNVGKTVDGVDGTSAWSEERATLVLQLNDAQKTIVRLRESRRKLEIELEKEKDKSTAPSTGKASLDKDKVCVYVLIFSSVIHDASYIRVAPTHICCEVVE